jgi:hypothetical protein
LRSITIKNRINKKLEETYKFALAILFFCAGVKRIKHEAKDCPDQFKFAEKFLNEKG